MLHVELVSKHRDVNALVDPAVGLEDEEPRAAQGAREAGGDTKGRRKGWTEYGGRETFGSDVSEAFYVSLYQCLYVSLYQCLYVSQKRNT